MNVMLMILLLAMGETTARGRLAPPSQIRCDLNSVTVYYGRVAKYSRTKTRTTLLIATDYGTTESVVLQTASPSRYFLLDGQPFVQRDWKKIEARRGILRPGMRVRAWVCIDGRATVDWRPGEAGPVD